MSVHSLKRSSFNTYPKIMIYKNNCASSIKNCNCSIIEDVSSVKNFLYIKTTHIAKATIFL